MGPQLHASRPRNRVEAEEENWVSIPDVRIEVQPIGFLLQPGQGASPFPLEAQQAWVPQHSLHQLLGLAQTCGGLLPVQGSNLRPNYPPPSTAFQGSSHPGHS